MSEHLIPSIVIGLFFGGIGIIIYQLMYSGSWYWDMNWKRMVKRGEEK